MPSPQLPLSLPATRAGRPRTWASSTLAAAFLAAVLVVAPGSARAETVRHWQDDTREPSVAAVPSARPPRTAAATAQAALPPAAVPAAMSSRLRLTAGGSRYLGSALSGIVLDSAPGAATPLWEHRSGTGRLPASTQKVLTAYTVLESMDPSTRLTTTVHQGTTARDGVYLRGAADPSLTRTRLAALARDTAAALKRQRRSYVSVYVDATVLPRPTAAAGWKSGYLRSDVQGVQGLPLAGYRGLDAAPTTGRLFAAYLTRHGITTVRYRGAAATPAQHADLARSTSAPVSSLVATMLAVSNNDYAEFLLRQAALARGRTPSWSGAIGHEVEVLAAGRIPLGGLRIADGSGLSRANRMPVRTLAAVLQQLWSDPGHRQVAFAWGAMPRAGQSGTLTTRYRTPQHACARGLVLAKTGTLADAVALAGVARGVDGKDRVFVLLENGIVGRNTSVRLALDSLATTAVGCALA